MSLDVSLEVNKCLHCNHSDEVFSANITHNLNEMAEEAGIYKHVWRPEELEEIKQAGDLIEPLTDGLTQMKEDPERFERHDSPNGWGVYEDFVMWLEEYLTACKQWPNATITVDR